MFKKGIAIFLILLANIILMAHPFMHHHNHEAENCVFNASCQSDENKHKHSDSENEHEHSGRGYNECCIFYRVIVIPSNNIRHYCKSPYYKDDKSKLFNNHYIFQSNKFQSLVPESERNPIPPLLFSYTQIVNNLLGLRAPPLG